MTPDQEFFAVGLVGWPGSSGLCWDLPDEHPVAGIPLEVHTDQPWRVAEERPQPGARRVPAPPSDDQATHIGNSDRELRLLRVGPHLDPQDVIVTEASGLPELANRCYREVQPLAREREARYLRATISGGSAFYVDPLCHVGR